MMDCAHDNPDYAKHQSYEPEAGFSNGQTLTRQSGTSFPESGTSLEA
jgi:hypothetical protein